MALKRFLPEEKRWRRALLVAALLFLATRLASLTAFPIFNAEAIYLQYAQAIHEDWQANKFVSMNGQYNDWKPPLQYWMAAPFIQLGNDPLVVGRMVALVFSVGGFIGFYAFGRELFGEKEGVLSASSICFVRRFSCTTINLPPRHFSSPPRHFFTGRCCVPHELSRSVGSGQREQLAWAYCCSC